LNAAGPGRPHAFLPADLLSLAAVRELATAITARAPHVDLLLNNAGGTLPKGVTAEGIDKTLALNVVSPFLLTSLLRGALRGGAVVNVVTKVQSGAKVDPDNLTDFGGIGGYGRAKLALEMVTVEQAARFPEFKTNCAHPGIIPGTSFGAGVMPGFMLATGAFFAKLFRFGTTAEAAVACFRAAAESPERGKFFVEGAPTQMLAQVNDADVRARLWAKLEALVK
jgi:NAD(P)-dependent dehydrogenase (short-subunit alcohol dehydrogenase family)